MASGIDPNALRAAREEAGLTQHELARLVGAAGGERISRWELGTSSPRPDFLVRLANALDIPALRLIHLDGDVLFGQPGDFHLHPVVLLGLPDVHGRSARV